MSVWLTAEIFCFSKRHVLLKFLQLCQTSWQLIYLEWKEQNIYIYISVKAQHTSRVNWVFRTSSEWRLTKIACSDSSDKRSQFNSKMYAKLNFWSIMLTYIYISINIYIFNNAYMRYRIQYVNLKYIILNKCYSAHYIILGIAFNWLSESIIN